MKISLWLSRVFRVRNHSEKPERGIFAIEFDPSEVTKAVKQDIKTTINMTKEINKKHKRLVYQCSVASMQKGGDLGSLVKCVMSIDGIDKHKSVEISRYICSRANAIIKREKQKRIGITHAIWLYSGAPCLPSLQPFTAEDRLIDDLHKTADGKEYEVHRGMLINGVYTWPGHVKWCKCLSKSITRLSKKLSKKS